MNKNKTSRKIHYRNLRLWNNAGVDYPECKAGSLLDIENQWITSGYRGVVTCKHCLRMIARRGW